MIVQCGMKLHSVLICLHRTEHFIIFSALLSPTPLSKKSTNLPPPHCILARDTQSSQLNCLARKFFLFVFILRFVFFASPHTICAIQISLSVMALTFFFQLSSTQHSTPCLCGSTLFLSFSVDVEIVWIIFINSLRVHCVCCAQFTNPTHLYDP